MGQLIEWYIPKPKAPVTEAAPVVEKNIAASDLLRELLGRAETIEDVVILMRDADGILGLVSNIDGMGDTFMFMEAVRQEMITRFRAGLTDSGEGPAQPDPDGVA